MLFTTNGVVKRGGERLEGMGEAGTFGGERAGLMMLPGAVANGFSWLGSAEGTGLLLTQGSLDGDALPGIGG